MSRIRWGAIALALGLMCLLSSPVANARQGATEQQQPSPEAVGVGVPEEESSPWLLNALSDSFEVQGGATLRFEHTWGDVRVEATETDRVQVTALAQYHRDDPRAPAVRVSQADGTHQLVIDFAHLEIAENEAWEKRRIDVGLLVPLGLEIEVRTDRGLIEVKKMEAVSRLVSDKGDIVYKGSGSLSARTERGSLTAQLLRTGDGRTVDLSTLTGDIRCILLEGARAEITLETRGIVATDHSVEIDREAGSPLKIGRIRIGEGGTAISLTSHSGGVRLQSLIVPEAGDAELNESSPGG